MPRLVIIAVLLAALWAGEQGTRATRAVFSEHERQEIDTLPPQEQTMRLLKRAVGQYEGAAAIRAERVRSFHGQIALTPELNTLVNAAYNSPELAVRDLAIEVTLAARATSLTSESVETVAAALRDGQGDLVWNLWTLGLLGSRGIATARVRQLLEDALRDPDVKTRTWAVNALGLLGSDDVIPVLLRVFRTEPVPSVRERAACNIADSGRFSREQRMLAVPELLAMMDDPDLDDLTRVWVFQALGEITGENLGRDAAAWRNWSARRAAAQ
jgi:HEAT repeat protein